MDRCSRRSADRSGAIGSPRRQAVWRTSAGRAPAGGPTTAHDGNYRRIDSVGGFSQQTPFEAEFQNPDLPGGAAWRIVPIKE
jgi:hypothetical protein